MNRNLLAAILLFSTTTAAEPVPETTHPAGTATLPLTELLRLMEERTGDGETVPDPRPPMGATVERLELAARVLDDVLDVNAHVEVRVLSADQWIAVPLFQLEAGTTVTSLPVLEDAAFAIEKGKLTLMTAKPGRHVFDLSLVVISRREDGGRVAELAVGNATLSTLVVEADETLFRLDAGGSRRTQKGLLVPPAAGGRFRVGWSRIAAEATPTAVAARTPREPSIPRAQASIVSTLEGRAVVRTRYELRLQGTQSIRITIPADSALEKVYLNGAVVPFTGSGREVRLEVQPARSGDDSAVLELSLSRALGGFLLSGSLRFTLPAISWPIDEQYLQLHLPEVFTWRRTGGSLEPTGAAPPVAFTHEIPQPGKSMAMHQFLIAASASDVSLEYDVDLTDRYFR